MKNIFTIFIALIVITAFNAALANSIEITDERATAEYWISRNATGEKILMNEQQISQLNEQMISKDEYSANLLTYPKKFSAEEVKSKIRAAWDNESDEAIDGLYISQTQEVTIADFNRAKNNRNIDKIAKNVKVRYAVTVERGDIRLLPNAQAWYDNPNMLKYDILQGTAIDPAEAVAVLAESADKEFVFVQSRNYFGWLAKSSIAFTTRDTWLNYVKPKDFLVVTANKKNFNISGKDFLFQMGAVIPMVSPDSGDDEWFIILPTSDNGKLNEIDIPIDMNDAELNKGFLPCTENNFIRQSFKFLGDEYGWGGMDKSVDCSAFVEDIYRSMGIEIPRDSNRQEGIMPIWAVFNDVTLEERFDITRRAPVGSLLFKPGHVMMKLGNDDNGNPIIIHSASSYFTFNDEVRQKHYIRKVLVSDLNFMNGKRVKTIDGLTGISYFNTKNR